MSARCILVHKCGLDREPKPMHPHNLDGKQLYRPPACTCAIDGGKRSHVRRIEAQKAKRLVARGRATWWRRWNANGRWVEVHSAIVLVASEWPRTRLLSQRDIEESFHGNADALKRIQDFGPSAAEI